jgi:hypothetical protein
MENWEFTQWWIPCLSWKMLCVQGEFDWLQHWRIIDGAATRSYQDSYGRFSIKYANTRVGVEITSNKCHQSEWTRHGEHFQICINLENVEHHSDTSMERQLESKQQDSTNRVKGQSKQLWRVRSGISWHRSRTFGRFAQRRMTWTWMILFWSIIIQL